jgi:hypothetical protein
VQGRLLLDVVVGEGAVAVERLTRKDEALLVRRNTIIELSIADFLDLSLDHFDRVGRLYLDGDCRVVDRLNEHLLGGNE